MAGPARADIPPDPNSVDAHCSLAEQCPKGVFCDFKWVPGGKDQGEAKLVGLECRQKAEAKGLEERCSRGGNYSGQTLHCPKGATGSWSPKGAKPATPEAPRVEPVFAPVVEPVAAPEKAEPVAAPEKAEPVAAPAQPAADAKVVETRTETEAKSGCSVEVEGRGGWLWFALVGVPLLRRRRG